MMCKSQTRERGSLLQVSTLPANLREALGKLNTTQAVNASAFRPNSTLEYQPGNRGVCSDATWRAASLGLLQEQPLAGLFPALGNQSAFPVSGVAVHDGLLLTTFAKCGALEEIRPGGSRPQASLLLGCGPVAASCPARLLQRRWADPRAVKRCHSSQSVCSTRGAMALPAASL